MIGVATGLAEAGFIPFAYSIATFASLRAYEFVRDGPVLHGLPVRIIGVGGGFEYGSAGATHYGLEDLGVMRLQPGLTVVAPADYRQAGASLVATYALARPVYFRIGKDDVNEVPGLDGRFQLGRATVVREGGDLMLVTMGAVTRSVVAAAEELASKGIRAGVCVVSSFNPSPVDDLRAILEAVPVAVTVEAHYLDGALGSFVCEVGAENGLATRVVRCGVTRMPNGESGSEGYMLKRFGLTSDAVAATAERALVAAGR